MRKEKRLVVRLGELAAGESYLCRQSGVLRHRVGGQESGRVEQRRGVELIHGGAVECVVFGYLRGHLWLIALVVKGRAEGTSEGRLEPVIAVKPHIHVVPVADVVIDPRRPLILIEFVRGRGAELYGAGDPGAQQSEGPTAAVGAGRRNGRTNSRRAIVYPEQLLIKGDLRRVAGRRKIR